MPAPLSLDMRQRILEAVQAGDSRRTVARHFRVSPNTVQNLMNLYRETGSLEPKKPPGRPSQRTEPMTQEIRELLDEQPDLLRREIKEQLSLPQTEQTISQWLIQMGFTRKKNLCEPVSRTGPTF